MANQAPVLEDIDQIDLPAPDARAASTDRSSAPAPASNRFLFSATTRYAVVAALAVMVPLSAIVYWEPREPHAYLRAMFQLYLLFIVVAIGFALVAALRAPAKDRVVRWMWATALVLGVGASIQAYQRIEPGMDPGFVRTLSPIAIGLVLLLVANTLMLRARSGERAALVDASDLIMATLAIATALILAFGHTALQAEESWFTVSAGLWGLLAFHGTMVAMAVRARVEPGHRLLAQLGIVFGVTIIVSSTAQVVLGVNDFALPAGPFLAASALALAAGVLFFAFTKRDASPGLERLPVGAQARRSSIIAMLVLGSIPVTGAIVWWQRDISWVPPVALLAGFTLLALSSIRHLLAAREANRLHALVEANAAKRGELLSEVMSHIDLDRHRAATHLHRQAASLYAAMASFTSAVNQATESDSPAAVSYAADRLRRDLGHRADKLRRLAEAIKPLEPEKAGARRLAVPMRAYLENVCGDGPQPDLRVDIDPELTLDWTTEALVLRIAQEATLHALWSARATTVDITVTADHEAIHLEIADDGNGEEPSNQALVTMRSMAQYMGGDLTTVAEPSAGGVVSATIPFATRTPDEQHTEQRPELRLVDGR